MSVTSSMISDPHFVDAVARRVVELLDVEDARRSGRHRRASPLTVAQVAARYGVSRSWVYAHQRELGAMRLGSGPRARLRFESKVVAAAIAGFERPGRDRMPPVDPSRGGREMPLISFDPMG
jgi:hypothetical protein